MFRNRQSSQKPPDELFERFRQSFPDVRAVSGAGSDQPGAALANGQESSLIQSKFNGHEDLDPTPRALAEPFRFTPSLTPSVFMDPSSSAFAAFANAPPGLFTPTPGVTNGSINGSLPALAQPINGQHDIGISIGTPLSLSAIAPASSADDQMFASQTLQPQQFSNFQFNQSLPSQYLDPTQYAPRPPSGPGSPMDCSGGEMSMDPLDRSRHMGAVMPSSIPMDAKAFDQMTHMHPGSENRFRFHVVLNAPTAMIKHPDEIPVTYLNKGQAYAISIMDAAPTAPVSAGVRYRTFIRISFHDETQRTRPAACWQLWKEGRGTNEAHHRGGKLQAVEYVENQLNGDEESKKGKVELEGSSFDGFSVVWAPSVTGAAETAVSVRFNFLSTDFSHSKGVKGIPVRLCAKTEVLSDGSPRSSTEPPEISYCKVKLFRDHGAERKLANDILHVKKTIEKLKQQANQIEGTGMKVFSKKTKKEDDGASKPGKAQKHKRTWSVSSASSVGGSRAQEEDTNVKLQSMEDMFSSTRPFSVLYLRGDEADDPDMHPVRLPGEPSSEDLWSHRRDSIAHSNATGSSFVSPTPSSRSISSQRGDSYSPDKDWEGRVYRVPTGIAGGDALMKMKTGSEEGLLSGWIEAIGVNPSYKPPEAPTKAAMCVYILPVLPDQSEKSSYYRAVYLQNRTASSLSSNVALKCGIDPSTVFRIVHFNAKGISILVDDDFVHQMNEGQDMKVQVQEVEDESILHQEWTNSQNNGDSVVGKKWELRILF